MPDKVTRRLNRLDRLHKAGRTKAAERKSARWDRQAKKRGGYSLKNDLPTIGAGFRAGGSVGKTDIGKSVLNWVNNSVGATMFLNTQTKIKNK